MSGIFLASNTFTTKKHNCVQPGEAEGGCQSCLWRTWVGINSSPPEAQRQSCHSFNISFNAGYTSRSSLPRSLQENAGVRPFIWHLDGVCTLDGGVSEAGKLLCPPLPPNSRDFLPLLAANLIKHKPRAFCRPFNLKYSP